MALMYTKNYWH